MTSHAVLLRSAQVSCATMKKSLRDAMYAKLPIPKVIVQAAESYAAQIEMVRWLERLNRVYPSDDRQQWLHEELLINDMPSNVRSLAVLLYLEERR